MRFSELDIYKDSARSRKSFFIKSSGLRWIVFLPLFPFPGRTGRGRCPSLPYLRLRSTITKNVRSETRHLQCGRVKNWGRDAVGCPLVKSCLLATTVTAFWNSCVRRPISTLPSSRACDWMAGCTPRHLYARLKALAKQAARVSKARNCPHWSRLPRTRLRNGQRCASRVGTPKSRRCFLLSLLWCAGICSAKPLSKCRVRRPTSQKSKPCS